MKLARITSPVLALAMIASASVLSVGATAPAEAATTSYSYDQLVASIPATPTLYVGYRRPTQFTPAATALKKDAKVCNLRQRMIISLAQVKPKVAARCKMTGGTWVTALGSTQKTARGLNIAPIMSYKEAWGQGAYAWTPAQRLAWATNTSPTPVKTRAKGVTQLQVTQKLYTARELTALSLVTSDASDESQALNEWIRSCNRDVGCLLRVASVWQYAETIGAFNLKAGVEACNGVVARLTNVAAWGAVAQPRGDRGHQDAGRPLRVERQLYRGGFREAARNH